MPGWVAIETPKWQRNEKELRDLAKISFAFPYRKQKVKTAGNKMFGFDANALCFVTINICTNGECLNLAEPIIECEAIPKVIYV